MRFVKSFEVAAAFIALAHFGWCAPSARSDELADSFVVHSVWQGTMEQSNPKSSYPAILFVKQRQDDSFEGTTYYPTLGNGLLQIAGRIDKTGVITFTEVKVIHAELLANGSACVANGKYTGKLEKRALKGTGELKEYIDPQTKRTIKLEEAIVLTFSLELAD